MCRFTAHTRNAYDGTITKIRMKKKTRSANKTNALTRNYDVWWVCVVSDERQQTDNDERLMQFFMYVFDSRCVCVDIIFYHTKQSILIYLGNHPRHRNRTQFFTLFIANAARGFQKTSNINSSMKRHQKKIVSKRYRSLKHWMRKNLVARRVRIQSTNRRLGVGSHNKKLIKRVCLMRIIQKLRDSSSQCQSYLNWN